MLRYILLVEVHNKKKWEPAALEGLWCDFCPGLALSVIVPPRAGHTAGSRQLASPNFWKNLILRSAFWDPPPISTMPWQKVDLGLVEKGHLCSN